MDRTPLRLTLTWAALCLILFAARPAHADVTITGTVGEIGVLTSLPNVGNALRFKLTDVTQTASCLDYFGSGALAKYAWFQPGDQFFKEWYAMLLVSKKGAPITCAVTGPNTNCHVTSCTLP